MLNGTSVKGYLSSIIEDLDSGKAPRRPVAPWWVRRVAVPTAFGLALGAASCVGDDPENGAPLAKSEAASGKADGFNDALCLAIGADLGCDICEELGWYGDGECDTFCDQEDVIDCRAVVMYGVPMPERNCADGVDNDYDGAFDCRDADCAADAACAIQPMYAASFEVCDNAADDDGDGLIDCNDPSCTLDPACTVQPMYAASFEDCENGVDDDGDGLVDCGDPNCRDLCVAMYGVRFPEDNADACADERDNDGDGNVDCADDECRDFCVAMYGVRVGEDDCTDGVDNDEDGVTDCDDTDCEADPSCNAAPAYASPF